MSTRLKTAEVLHADEKISSYGKARSTVKGTPHGPVGVSVFKRLRVAAALQPMLKEPSEHVKNRLFEHWGSSPGLAFTYR
jgi:hypothetical protein